MAKQKKSPITSPRKERPVVCAKCGTHFDSLFGDRDSHPPEQAVGCATTLAFPHLFGQYGSSYDFLKMVCLSGSAWEQLAPNSSICDLCVQEGIHTGDVRIECSLA